MKLVRYGPPRKERPGLLDAHGAVRDLSEITRDLDGDFLESAGFDQLKALPPENLPLAANVDRLGPPIVQPGKFVCVGLNYAAHADEVRMASATEPVLFMKAPSCIQGANDDIVIPPEATKVDWEVELGVVIGRRATRVSEQDAMNHVAGYCIVNDVSERAYQLEGSGQWMKGKSADTFGPVGPYLVTTDDVPRPDDLAIWLEVNGARMQESNTGNMIHSVPFLIHYISRFMTLLPGDLIATGTPAGVALGRDPAPWLAPGDKLRLGIDGLGVQSQTVRAWKEND